MLKRGRIKKLSKKEATRLVAGTQFLTCKVCGITKIRTNNDTTAITCSTCVSQMVAPPEQPQYLNKGSGKPRGWHLKKYFEFEGKVYSKGVEITDEGDIEALTSPSSKLTSSASKKSKKRKRNGNNSRKNTSNTN
jgi:hypothetical protein